MKKLISIITVSLVILVFGYTESRAQGKCCSVDYTKSDRINTSKRISFKVYGSCEKCEIRIEKAIEDIEGVYSADWNKKTKQVSISYDRTKVDENDLHIAIANAGHDTNIRSATIKAYQKYSVCCKFERRKK